MEEEPVATDTAREEHIANVSTNETDAEKSAAEEAIADESLENETVTEITVTEETEREETEALSDNKMRINLEKNQLTERFPLSIMESDIEIYYSDRVPQEMLDKTISLIHSTTNSKIISQIFLDTEYDPTMDTSNKAYSFPRSVMFIVKWDDDQKYPMFYRYFYHELGHLLLGEYMEDNGIESSSELPFLDEWVYLFCPDSIDEDFAKFYEYYRAWPDLLDVYVEYEGVGASVEIVKEVAAIYE